MGQSVGTLPETEVTVPCSGRVTADVIQNQIRNRGAAFATSPDADLLRAASKWVSDQYSWVLSDIQVAVYGSTGSWVFYAGSRANQVAFHANSDKIDEPAWERRGWKATIYNGFKMGLKISQLFRL
ncbi:hypothetical protein Bbelb_345330 [Branchiostoma belcheri]|nr:hypothetical protein Bbelb_345330 [Branchiostoma belcheri]